MPLLQQLFTKKDGAFGPPRGIFGFKQNMRNSADSASRFAPDSALHSALLLSAILLGGFPAAGATYVPARVTPPKPMRELRGVWIATVANLDWPSTNAMSTAQQKADLIAMLDKAVQLKLNVVVFQVRPSCDAMYASSLEPWSEYLTGTMGKAPQPFYDPLAFVIEEAHKRGLELHAWFNPYRARHFAARSPISSEHISKTRPDLVRTYGKYLWLDPGEPDVQEYSLKVVMDVVRRYDIDGVHFDDYFYPDKDFPDEASWRRYGIASKLSRDDWRRQNVNHFVERVSSSIKSVKPWVKFGICPFGIWRPQNPPQIKGKDAYADFFADSRLWLTKGWVDYFGPQLYWPIAQTEQSFPVLLKWWAEQNPKQRLLCPGLNTYNVGRSWKLDELLNQVRLTRKQKGASGHIHWRMSTLMENSTLDAALEHDLYGQPALVPAMPWLKTSNLAKPVISAIQHENRVSLEWNAFSGEKPWLWVLQARRSRGWSTEVFPPEKNSFSFFGEAPEYFALRAVDRAGNLSDAAVLKLSRN